jgi:tetratricopeptide (TPR) repeat protein
MLKLADLFYKKGDWVSALDYYDRAERFKATIKETVEENIQLGPEPETSEWILFRKIFIFKRLDRKQEANAALKKLKQLNPDSFWIRQVEKDVG